MAFCACSVAMIAVLVDAERGDLAGRELEIDHLVLGADDIDLADIRYGQDLRPGVFDIIAQLPLAQAVAGEGVDIAEDVAEPVVEERSDHARRELALDIGDHVADARPRSARRPAPWSSGSRLTKTIVWPAVVMLRV